jgi:hypothetical protein
VGAFRSAQRRHEQRKQNQKFLVGVERRRCLKPQSFGPGPILANVKTDRSYVPTNSHPVTLYNVAFGRLQKFSGSPDRLLLHNPPDAVYNPPTQTCDFPLLRHGVHIVYIRPHSFPRVHHGQPPVATAHLRRHNRLWVSTQNPISLLDRTKIYIPIGVWMWRSVSSCLACAKEITVLISK